MKKVAVQYIFLPCIKRDNTEKGVLPKGSRKKSNIAPKRKFKKRYDLLFKSTYKLISVSKCVKKKIKLFHMKLLYLINIKRYVYYYK